MTHPVCQIISTIDNKLFLYFHSFLDPLVLMIMYDTCYVFFLPFVCVYYKYRVSFLDGWSVLLIVQRLIRVTFCYFPIIIMIRATFCFSNTCQINKLCALCVILSYIFILYIPLFKSWNFSSVQSCDFNFTN